MAGCRRDGNGGVQVITFSHPSPETTMASWRLKRSGDLFTIIEANGDWFLGWNGPLFTPLEVSEQPRLLGEFREAKGRFANDKRPEVGEFYSKFETIIEGIKK